MPIQNPTDHLGLLLIDFQEVFLRAIPERERLLQRTLFSLKAAELLGISVAVTEQSPEKLGTTTETLALTWKTRTPVFRKSTFSAMAAKGLRDWIETKSIDHLLIAGIETPICIYQTAIDALGEGIDLTLLADCIGQRRTEDREPVLRQLLAMEAHILPSETIFYSLLGSAEHQKFRAFNRLIKEVSTS